MATRSKLFQASRASSHAWKQKGPDADNLSLNDAVHKCPPLLKFNPLKKSSTSQKPKGRTSGKRKIKADEQQMSDTTGMDTEYNDVDDSATPRNRSQEQANNWAAVKVRTTCGHLARSPVWTATSTTCQLCIMSTGAAEATTKEPSVRDT
jgi:hypothetical protein